MANTNQTHRVLLDEQDFSDCTNVFDLTFKLGRDSKEKGYTKSYNQQLVFTGEGYSYLRSSLLESGGCGNVIIEIYCLCSVCNDKLIVSGYIILKDIVLDEKHCTAQIKIEDNSVNSMFLKGKGTQIYMDRATTPNGTSIAPIRRPLWYFFDVNGGFLTQTDGVDYAYGYNVFDAFDFILQQISNGELRFDSDFFSIARQDARWLVEFENLMPGELATISFETEFGNTIKIEVEFDNYTATAEYFTSAINTHLGFYVVYSVTGSKVSLSIKSNGRKGTLNSAFTSGTGMATFTLLDAYIEGAGDLFITNGERLTNKLENPFFLSFEQLYSIVNNLFDLSYQIIEVSGQHYLKVEPLETFLTSEDTVDIGEVEVEEIKSIEDRIAGALMLGKPYQDDETPDYKFKNLNCGETIDRRIPDDVHIMGTQIVNQITGVEDYGTDLFLIEGISTGTGHDVPKRYDVGEYPTDNVSLYNVMLNNVEALLRYHLFFLPDAIDRQLITRTIHFNVAGASFESNVNKPLDYIGFPKQYILLYEFKQHLRRSEYELITGSSLIKFYARKEPNVAKYGYIEDVEHRLKGGITDFTLMVR